MHAIVATAQRTAADQTDGIMDMFASDTPEPIRLTANVAENDVHVGIGVRLQIDDAHSRSCGGQD